MDMIYVVALVVALSAAFLVLGRIRRDAQRLAFEQEKTNLVATAGRWEQEASSLRQERDAQKAASNDLESQLAEGRIAKARLEERESSLNARIAAQANELAALNDKLTSEFENISTRVLAHVSGQLSSGSEKQIEGLLAPLRERLVDFQKRVEDTYAIETREVLSLKAQIQNMVQINEALGTKAENLARALKGDVKTAGRWGELVLERILEDSGLVEGREFVRQGQGLGLKSEDGGTQRPDILVRLPEERCVIVDSKVPLTHYEAFVASDDAASKTESLGSFVKSVRTHISGLSGKRYQDNDQIVAHDFVLLFIPIEGALALALQSDSSLFSFAWDKQVILVGPSTLMMTLKTVGSIWRYQRQSENAEQIAKAGADLYDKLVGFVDELAEVGKRLDQAQASYATAADRLSRGKGNVLARAQTMIELGVKAKKTMPQLIAGAGAADVG